MYSNINFIESIFLVQTWIWSLEVLMGLMWRCFLKMLWFPFWRSWALIPSVSDLLFLNKTCRFLKLQVLKVWERGLSLKTLTQNLHSIHRFVTVLISAPISRQNCPLYESYSMLIPVRDECFSSLKN